MGKTILKAYRNVRKINSKITGAYNEGILGTKTTKTLVLENKKNSEFGKFYKITGLASQKVMSWGKGGVG